jgi:hypothetical protein
MQIAPKTQMAILASSLNLFISNLLTANPDNQTIFKDFFN